MRKRAKMLNYKAILDLLGEKDRYLILIHRNPDGDAIGSAEALRILLTHLGKEAHVLSYDPLPRYLSFLPTEQPLQRRNGQDLPEGYTYLSVDVAEEKLLGFSPADLAGGVYLKIDHHKTGNDFATHNFTDPTAAAAGEIIYHLGREAGISALDFFTACYTAIATDTGCFRYSNTTEETFLIASALLKEGIDTKMLNAALFESKEPKLVRANALGILNARFYMDGQVALLAVTNELRQREGLENSHLAELSSVLREIAGVELSVVLKEKEDLPGSYRISARSKHFFDCTALCGAFGGGGHARAAGGDVQASDAEEALSMVLEKIKEQF